MDKSESINTERVPFLTKEECEEILYAWDKLLTFGSGGYDERDLLNVREAVRQRLDELSH